MLLFFTSVVYVEVVIEQNKTKPRKEETLSHIKQLDFIVTFSVMKIFKHKSWETSVINLQNQYT